LLTLNGLGADADRTVVAFHQSYSKYVDFMTMMKQHLPVNIQETTSFLVNLGDESHYQPPTFSELANYVAKMEKKEWTTKPRVHSSRNANRKL
jgi:hypothetical protein